MTTSGALRHAASAWSSRPLLTPPRLVTPSASPAGSNLRNRSREPRNTSSTPAPGTTGTPVIYAVDDTEDLTELYVSLLETTGHRLKTFNDRTDALIALTEERTKPKLLITDYFGLSMSIDQFLSRCLAIHPTLQILMASGFNRSEMRFLQAKPDRFLEKPFTPEEFQREVKLALAT